MKKNHVPSLDDIVFQGRNQEYGAYVLRRKNSKYVGIGIVISLILLLGGLGYPVLASLFHKGGLINENISIESIILAPPTNEAPPPPPPPPPPVEKMAERLKFIAPIVVDEDVESTLPTNDEINSRPYSPPPSEESVEPQPEATPVIETPPPAEIFTVVEEAPSFPGGEEARIRFLKENIHYPEEAKQLGIQGKVYITFVVEADGSITDIKILRGIGAGCDEEAIRVVKAMPNWIPGKQRAHPVRVQFNLPIGFVLL